MRTESRGRSYLALHVRVTNVERHTVVYEFDMTGGSRKAHSSMPVAILGPDRERKEGVFYVLDFDFASKSGGCWKNSDDTVTLFVHSNCSYTFRILPEGATP